MNAKEAKKVWKANHIKGLESIGFKASQFNRLRQLENVAHWRAEQYCNGRIDGDTWEKVESGIEKAIKRLHGGTLPAGFFVNSDPRGYALKINNEKTQIPEGLHKDWGGYGCLAPEF